jgi:hypothetical protein
LDECSDSDLSEIAKEKGECCLSQLKVIVKNAVVYINVYCKNIYENLIQFIKNDSTLINKAKSIYDNFLIRNRRALFYYQMAINTATPSIANYHLINNILSLLDTKFDKIDINFGKKLNNEEINKILNFFENNYIVGVSQIKMEDIKDFNIKEISNIKKEKADINKKEIEGKDKDKEEEEPKYVGIILLEERIICACNEKGYIHFFNLDNDSFKGALLLSVKAHDKQIISVDNIKNTRNKFVTCDEKNIKLWRLKKQENEYSIENEIVFQKISNSEIIYLYVLNNSNMISFINESSQLIILNSIYKPFVNFKFSGSWLTSIYQINSKDENGSKLIIGARQQIFILETKNFKMLGSIDCNCYFPKSLMYYGDNILLVGGKGYVSIVNFKNFKLEYIIKIKDSECSCFLKFNDIILCGYGDTSESYSFSYGIADRKNTKFCVVRKNKDNYESILISDIFYKYGIINALWIDKNRFISCFYNDDNLKVYQIK